MDEVPIPKERVEEVLRTLGSTDPLERDAYTLSSLRSLVAESPANAIFDWRESVDGAIEIIEGIIGEMPKGWHRRARSVKAVQAAAKAKAPDTLWIPWGDNGLSDTEMFLLVRARHWREIEECSWLLRVLAPTEREPEPELPDRGEQTTEVAERVLAHLAGQGEIEFEGDDTPPGSLTDALAAKLRTLYPGNPVLGAMLGDWLIARPEVGDLFLDDDILGVRVATVWNEFLGKLEEFPGGACAGDEVTIRGSRYQNAQWVKLGGKDCLITGNRPHLQVRIPKDLREGSHAFAICCRDGTVRGADERIEIFPPRRR